MSENILRNEEAASPPKTLRWYDGFMLALPVATGVFVSIGYTIGAIGTIPAVLICLLLSVVALLQNKLFSEMASMFADKAGGVALFAAEGWKRYFSPIAPIAAVGYWSGWALTLSLVSLTIGQLVHTQWFPEVTWTIFDLGGVHFDVAHVIAAVCVVACTLLNILGIRVALRFNQVIGVAFVLVLLAIALGPLLAGQWSADRLESHVDGGWVTIVVWLYVSAWAIYGSELTAIFAPEYRDTSRDTSKALKSVAMFMIGAYTIVPLATGGQLSRDDFLANPVGYGIVSFDRLFGGFSAVITVILCGALFLIMISASADASRALFGMSAERMSIKQWDHLNRRGVPSRALWTTMVVNLAILSLIGNPVAILIASNLGYLLAVTLAVFAFLLLRKDRPNWPRPIRLARAWVPIAVVVGAFNAFILVVGAMNPGLSYVGGFKEVFIGLGFLLVGVLLYLYRQVVQDKAPVQWRVLERETSVAARSEQADLIQGGAA